MPVPRLPAGLVGTRNVVPPADARPPAAERAPSGRWLPPYARRLASAIISATLLPRGVARCGVRAVCPAAAKTDAGSSLQQGARQSHCTRCGGRRGRAGTMSSARQARGEGRGVEPGGLRPRQQGSAAGQPWSGGSGGAAAAAAPGCSRPRRLRTWNLGWQRWCSCCRCCLPPGCLASRLVPARPCPAARTHRACMGERTARSVACGGRPAAQCGPPCHAHAPNHIAPASLGPHGSWSGRADRQPPRLRPLLQ